MQQGKHRDSARLYSRDDTIASLHVQEKVREALHSGWRPARSMARGGQAPLPEPPLKPFFKPAWTVLSPTHLSQPALARWTTRQERDTDASSARIPASVPPSLLSLQPPPRSSPPTPLRPPASTAKPPSSATGLSSTPAPPQTRTPPPLPATPRGPLTPSQPPRLHKRPARPALPQAPGWPYTASTQRAMSSSCAPATARTCALPAARALPAPSSSCPSTLPPTSAAALLAACSASRSKPAPQLNCSCLPACSPATLAPARSRFLA